MSLKGAGQEGLHPQPKCWCLEEIESFHQKKKSILLACFTHQTSPHFSNYRLKNLLI